MNWSEECCYPRVIELFKYAVLAWDRKIMNLADNEHIIILQ